MFWYSRWSATIDGRIQVAVFNSWVQAEMVKKEAKESYHSAYMWPSTASQEVARSDNMGIHIPRMPCLALFVLLLLLPLPISKARSFRYRGPGWKLLHRLGNTFPAFHQRQIKRMKQNLSQRQSGEDCQGVFDLYIILDKWVALLHCP